MDKKPRVSQILFKIFHESLPRFEAYPCSRIEGVFWQTLEESVAKNPTASFNPDADGFRHGQAFDCDSATFLKEDEDFLNEVIDLFTATRKIVCFRDPLLRNFATHLSNTFPVENHITVPYRDLSRFLLPYLVKRLYFLYKNRFGVSIDLNRKFFRFSRNFNNYPKHYEEYEKWRNS